MPNLMRKQVSPTTKRLGLFLFIFLGCTHLLSATLIEADSGKDIKTHPNAQKKSLQSADDLKAKAETYNREAISLFEEGRYAEAQELWGMAIDLIEHPRVQHPDFEAVVEEPPPVESLEAPGSMAEPSESSPMADKYQSGLSLLEQKEYGEAQKVFEEIEAAQPGYRNTKKYLIVIDELLREENLPMAQEQVNDEAMDQITADQPEYTEVTPEPRMADLEFDRRQEEAQWEEAVEQSEQKLQDQIEERVAPIYQKALQHYKRKEYVEARDSFEQVQVLSPDYKLTAKYLDGIDDDILYAQQQKEEEQRLAEERSRRQDELEFRKTIAAKEAAYRKELTGQAEQIYQQAIEDFKSRRFEEAEDNFRKVEAISSGYKLTGKYLERVQEARDEEARLQAAEESRRQALMQHNEEEDLKRTIEESERMRQQGLREKAEAVYQKARTDYGQGEMEKARVGFAEAGQILPDYRSTRKYLALIDEDMAREKRSEPEILHKPKAAKVLTKKARTAVMPTSRKRLEAQEFYQQAKESYKKREFAKAKELFEKANAAVRGYQATEKFLARIDSDIQKETRYQQDMREREARRQAKETRYQQDLQRRDAQRQAREKALEQKRAAANAAVVQRRQETRELKETAARIKNDRDKMVAGKIQELYREAESDYKNGLYALARDRFNEVQRIAPGYRSTEEYLGNIAYAYGGETTVAPIPVSPRVEQEVLQVSVPVAEEQIIVPAGRKAPFGRKITAHKVTEQDGEAAEDYDAGVLLFKRKEYVRAREKFNYVDQLDPGYKSTSEYLSRIDSLLQEEQQRQLEEQQQALARAIRKEKKAKKAVPPEVVQQTVSEAQKPGHEGAAAAPVEAGAKEDLDRELHGKAQELFQDAERLYASRQFVPAREKFLEIEGLLPGYKSTGKYLDWIDRDLLEEQKKTRRAKQKQEREAASRAAKEKTAEKIAEKNQLNIQKLEEMKRARLLAQAEKKYAQALAAYAKKDFISAKQKFAEVEKFSANFKETAQYLSRIDADIAAQNQKPTEVVAAPIYVQPQGIAAKEQTRQKAEEFFREAVRLYASQKFVPAREKFQEAEKLEPGYKTTEKYIRLTDRAIARRQEKESQTKKAHDVRGARLEADARKVREKAEKFSQAKEGVEIKRLLARMEKEAVAASNRGQWDAAARKLSSVEDLLKGESVSAADKEQTARRVAGLRERIVTGREEAQQRQLAKEQETKQRQDARTALLEADAQRERERVEKNRQENERKQQARAKRVPAAAPAVKSPWVDQPDFNAFELTDDVGVLRRQYAQIQKERKGVQAAIRLRLDQTYAQAVRLYNQGYYAGAKNLFQEIAEIQPSFKGTKSYFARIDQRLANLPASAIMPGKGIEAPSVYVKPRTRVVTDALDSLEAPRQ